MSHIDGECVVGARGYLILYVAFNSDDELFDNYNARRLQLIRIVYQDRSAQDIQSESGVQSSFLKML
jgi:hypothetical protein